MDEGWSKKTWHCGLCKRFRGRCRRFLRQSFVVGSTSPSQPLHNLFLLLVLHLFMFRQLHASGVSVGDDVKSVQTHNVFVGHSVQLDCYPPTVAPDKDVFIVQWRKHQIPSPVYLWRKEQSEREGNGYEGRLSLRGVASLVIVDVRHSDTGFYDCQVWDVNGHPRVNGTTVLLQVLFGIPRFTVQPQSLLLAAGNVAEFQCAVEPPATTLRWLLDDRPVAAPGVVVVASNGSLQVRVSHDLKTQEIQSGAYRCVAEWNSVVLYSKSANLTVAVIAQFKEQEDVYVAANEGGYAVIQGSIPSSIPTANVMVKHNGTALPQSSSSSRTILMPSGNLHIHPVRGSDAGTYQFSAQNPVTREWIVAKNVVILRVTVPDRSNSAQLLAAPKGSNVAVVGSNISLECGINGHPMPIISWSKFGGVMPVGRFQQVLGNLFLYDLRANDTGTYVCQAQNSVGLPVVANAALNVFEVPEIHKWDSQVEIHEREEVTLECRTKGIAKPDIRWIHNGRSVVASNMVIPKESRLNIRYAQKEHAGFYQCFASNVAGVVQAIMLLRVVPRTVAKSDMPVMTAHGHRREHGPQFLDGNWAPSSVSGRNSSFAVVKDDAVSLGKAEETGLEEETVEIDHDNWPAASNPKRNRKKNRKKQKKRKFGMEDSDSRVVMVPPTRPKVTKLTDESVMVRWDVPPNSGLPIQFFKVQYKDLTEHSEWMTIDEDIAPHVLSYEVLNLRTGHTYVFRIAAVYSNNDNNLGPNSHKFVLYKDPPMKKPIVGPTIVHAEAISPSAISIRWQHLVIDEIPIEGFFIYCRATTSAGHYTKITVLGANALSYIISHLLPETAYDFKMQCFNSAGTSDFSNIYTEKTLPSPDSNRRTDEDFHHVRPPPASNTADSDQMLFTLLGSLLFVLVALFLTVVGCCTWKQRRRRKRHRDNMARVAANGSLSDLAKCNGSAISNGHARGNGMFLWEKMNGDLDHNHVNVAETSLVEIPPRIVQNNNRGEAMSNEEESADVRDEDEVVVGGQDDPASSRPLIHKQYHDGCGDNDSNQYDTIDEIVVYKNMPNGVAVAKVDVEN